MLYFTERDVRRLLPMRETIARMREVFAALAEGTAQNQVRRRLVLPTGSVLHQMAGAFKGYFGTKIYATNPRSGAHFAFILYASGTAKPLALFEANWLGQIRTGAVTGFATDLLAPREARTLGLIGSGFQARSQVEAVHAVRPLQRVRVWSRTVEGRERFAREIAAELRIAVEPASSAEEAVRDAAIVVTAASAKEPLFEADWVESGAHVNAVGANNLKRRELPDALLRRAGLIAVDSVEQARVESGDLAGILDDPRVIELKDVRERPPGITIFKSLGLAVEDVAAAAYVYEAGKSTAPRLPLYS